MTSPQHLAERALDLGACPPASYADANSRRRGVLQTMLRGEQDRARRLQSLIDRASADLADSRTAITAVEAELAALGAADGATRECGCCRRSHPVADFDGDSHVCRRWRVEIVPGTSVELDSLAPNQAVGWGDGKTNYRLYTLIEAEEPAHAG